MENNMPCKIVGAGVVRIRTFDGAIKTLTYVWHIPELK